MMKKKLNYQTKAKTLFKVGVIATTMGSAIANTDYIEDQFSGEIPIDIDGSFSRPSESSKLEQVRKKLEKQNEEMVQKKIEDIRVDNEKKLTNQLQSALAGKAPLSSSVPADSNVSKQDLSDGSNNDLDLGLSVGVSNISGTGVDLETSITGKITLESRVSNRFLVGLGIGYTNIEMTPLSDVIGSSYFSSYYGSGFYNVGGDFGAPVDYDQLDISANGKYLLSTTGKLRPYVGLGVMYSRFNMDSNYQFTYFSANPVNSIDGSFISLNTNVGARLMFTNDIGMNLELNYSRGVGGVLGTRDSISLLDPNSSMLFDIANEIAESNIFGIQAGILFSF